MKRFHAVLGAAGLAICIVIISRIGGFEVIRELKAARAGLLILVGFSFVRLALQTVAWSTALRAEGIRAPVLDLVGVRLAAQSAGYLSVLGPAVSEPLRVRLLLKYRGVGMAATLADSGVYGLSSCLFGIIGCVCAALVMVHGMQITPLILLGGALLIGMFLITRSKPLIGPLVRLLAIRPPSWLSKGEQIETEVRQFGNRHRVSVCMMLWTDLACQVLLAGDIVVIAWCLGVPFHAATVLALEAGTRAVRMIAGWVPARIGVDETGAIAAFAALGLPSATGLALALARRLRDLLACALGFAWLLWKARSLREDEMRPSAPRLLPDPSIRMRPEQVVAVE